MAAAREPRLRMMPRPPARRTALARFLDGWRELPAAMIVLRLFLGLTFLYAGAQKLLDPNFLRSGSPDYIGTQLRGFAQGSPIAWLLDPMTHVAVLAGLGVALLEIAIGLGTLAGVAPRASAALGLVVNVSLLLSATWHVHPYFLGSDSIYAVAWGAYLLGLLEHSRHRVVAADPPGVRSRHAVEGAIGRRELLRGASLAGATLASATTARLLSGTPAAATLAATTQTPSLRSAHGASSSPSPQTTKAVHGTPIAQLSNVPVGGAIGFQAPNGTPAALVRLTQDEVVAYSRVCTHAGCLVGYDSSQRILYCPCHGAEYDPAHHAEVIGGPAPRPLEQIPVKIDPATGEVVVPKRA
jgi:thiosulfate dehydrogenase [quinone] large subunit